MQRQTNATVPRHITEVLDASLDDIAAGRLNGVDAVQAEAREMLADRTRAEPSGRSRIVSGQADPRA